MSWELVHRSVTKLFLYFSTFYWFFFMNSFNFYWNLARYTPWIFCSLFSSATFSAVCSSSSLSFSIFYYSCIILNSYLLHWIFKFSISFLTYYCFNFCFYLSLSTDIYLLLSFLLFSAGLSIFLALSFYFPLSILTFYSE